jgi:Ca2+/H+ antiporter
MEQISNLCAVPKPSTANAISFGIPRPYVYFPMTLQGQGTPCVAIFYIAIVLAVYSLLLFSTTRKRIYFYRKSRTDLQTARKEGETDAHGGTSLYVALRRKRMQPWGETCAR